MILFGQGREEDIRIPAVLTFSARKAQTIFFNATGRFLVAPIYHLTFTGALRNYPGTLRTFSPVLSAEKIAAKVYWGAKSRCNTFGAKGRCICAAKNTPLDAPVIGNSIVSPTPVEI